MLGVCCRVFVVLAVVCRLVYKKLANINSVSLNRLEVCLI